MNVLKRMESAFLVSLAIAGFGGIAVEAVAPAQASVPAVVENPIAVPGGMAVVKVSAKRMSAAEKARSGSRA